MPGTYAVVAMLSGALVGVARADMAAPLADVYVSGADLNVRRYTQEGELVQTLPVPYPGVRAPADTLVRGTAVDATGQLVVFNGGSSPTVAIYDGGSWSHLTAEGLSVPQTPTGKVASLGSYVYATDFRASAFGTDADNGIVRFNTAVAGGAWERFASGADHAHDVYLVRRGLDGLLYVMSGVDPMRRTVQAYNPYSMALIRSATLTGPISDLAVDEVGRIYATFGLLLPVSQFAPDGGAPLKTLAGGFGEGLDIAADGSILVGSPTSGVRRTDTSLESATTIIPNSGTTQNYVTFSTYAPSRGWAADGNASWTGTGNWSYGYVPNAGDGSADSIAAFGPVITAPRLIDLDANVTVSTLAFDSAVQYSLRGRANTTLTLEAPSGQRGWVDVTRGTHLLQTKVKLDADATISQAAGASLVISTPAGSVPMNFDIGAHVLVWVYAEGESPIDAVRTYLNAGRNVFVTHQSPAWVGQGIVSSIAAADASRLLGVGYAEAADIPGYRQSTIAGMDLEATSLVIKVAEYGDADLNGVVDQDDYALLDRGFARHLGNPHWIDGDFNYDGKVNSLDYALIDRTVGMHQGLAPELLAEREGQFGSDYVAGLVGSVPEPSACAMLVAGGLLGMRRLRACQCRLKY